MVRRRIVLDVCGTTRNTLSGPPVRPWSVRYKTSAWPRIEPRIQDVPFERSQLRPQRCATIPSGHQETYEIKANGERVLSPIGGCRLHSSPSAD